MFQKIKDNKLPIIVVTLMFAVLAVAVYYVNRIYIPGQKAARAEAVMAERAAEEAAREAEEAAEQVKYDYTITPDPAKEETTSFGSGSNVTVTTDENGDVWIDREWGDTEGLTVTTPPAEATGEVTPAGNMTGGTYEDILGEDGVYYGESDVGETSPASNSSGNATGGSSANSSSSDISPSSGSNNGGDESSSPGSSSAPPSDTTTTVQNKDGEQVEVTGQFPANPKNGERVTVNGVEYGYFFGFGWIECGSGSVSIPIEGMESSGEQCSNASWG